MRSPARARLLPALAVLLVAAPGCSVTLPGAGGDGPGDGPSSSAPGESSATAACAEVRAGIDAFNEADFEETVRRFEAALPLAEEHAEDRGGRRAALLLEAVRWYAELPPEDYPAASRTSGEFARYKAVTLAQCVVGSPDDRGPEDEAPSGGTDV